MLADVGVGAGSLGGVRRQYPPASRALIVGVSFQSLLPLLMSVMGSWVRSGSTGPSWALAWMSARS